MLVSPAPLPETFETLMAEGRKLLLRVPLVMLDALIPKSPAPFADIFETLMADGRKLLLRVPLVMLDAFMEESPAPFPEILEAARLPSTVTRAQRPSRSRCHPV